MSASPSSAAETPVTISLPAAQLASGHVLVGESGGRSVVYDVQPSSMLPWAMAVETEHGFLYLDADPSQTFEVLAEEE